MTVCIVTDSAAHFNSPHFAEQQGVVVVPYQLDIADKQYRDGVDMSAEELFRVIARSNEAVRVIAPSREAYVAVYQQLVRDYDGIISIHSSQHLSQSYQNALEASQQFAGHCPIAVIDSGQICFGQGLLVKAAIRACQGKTSFDIIVQTVRGVIERLYSIYYVETVNYLAENGLLSLSHGVMTTLIGLKLVLSMEEGYLRPIEKVRTRAQAVERLVEFAGEFAEIEEGVIVQPKTVLAESARMVQDRLLNDFPAQAFPYALYSPVLAALIGTDATGIVILEKEMRGIEDDF